MTNNSKDNSGHLKPLFDILALPEKKCQNDIFDWHVYPKTRDKPYRSYAGDGKHKNQTFMVVTKGKKTKVGVFCYHCFLGWLGKTFRDWKNAGATKKEIDAWIPKPDKKPMEIGE